MKRNPLNNKRYEYYDKRNDITTNETTPNKFSNKRYEASHKRYEP